MTSRIVTICATIALSMTASLALAGEQLPQIVPQPGLRIPHFEPPPREHEIPFAIGCVAFRVGLNTEVLGMGHDILLMNKGPRTIPRGTRIHWIMENGPEETFEGDYQFVTSLATGNDRIIIDALAIKMPVGHPCTVKVLINLKGADN